MNKLILFTIIITIFITSCKEEVSIAISEVHDGLIFKTVPADHSKIEFTNLINENYQRNTIYYDNFYNGSGVAIGDFNNDGLQDLFFTGNDSPNKIYLNKGNLIFEDISDKSLPKTNEWSNGVTLVDINNDGFMDIFICNSNMELNESRMKNQLLINNGDLTFSDQTKQYGLDLPSQSTQASFFDFDLDGDLDLWVNNTDNFRGLDVFIEKQKSVSKKDYLKHSINLYRNDNGKFTEISVKAGVIKPSFGLGLSIADFNDDGWLDVYVGNDYFLTDYYFINNKNGTFTDQSNALLDHTSFFSMGCDAADFNNDNILDFGAVDMTPGDHVRNKVMMESMNVDQFNFLKSKLNYVNQYMFNVMQLGVGEGRFNEIGKVLGTGQTDWSWAALFADFNCDGLKDYYITNGYLKDTKNNDFKQLSKKYSAYKDPKTGALISDLTEEEFKKRQAMLKSTPLKNYLFNNVNGIEFQDYSDKSDELPGFSNGAAYADLDNDGDLDLVINNLSSKATLLENKTSKPNYLKVKLQNNNRTDNIKHSKLLAYQNGKLQRIDYSFTRGYLSEMEHTAFFGFNSSDNLDSLVVIWPSGENSIIKDIKLNQVLNIDKSKMSATPSKGINNNPYFSDVTQPVLKFAITSSEVEFDDFNKEVLLPQKYSSLGPCLASGEINQKPIEEFYLGGSKGYPGRLFTYQNGEFTIIPIDDFEVDKNHEDLGCLFFDADNDNDLDLYVASGGGGEIENSTALLQDRLYLNDGLGQFKRSKNALPIINSSTKAIVAIDFDKDGDKDLFIGGRNTPGKYPLKSNSYLLRNDNGKFINIISNEMQNSLPDMVTDVIASDLNMDGYEDLVVVGEWSSPKFYFNNKGTFEFKENNTSDLVGWWQSIDVIDIDNDNDMDIIIGNIGENNKFHPSKEKPLGILVSDFDKSGTLDIVLTKKYKDMTVPVRGKECSSQQMPFINEKFPTYNEFATSDIESVLGQDNIDKAFNKQVNTFSHYYLINDGKGKFDVNLLPKEAQFGPILGMLNMDLNKDGYMDVITIGCIEETEPETPSYDSNKGLILINKQTKEFDAIYDIRKTGIISFQNAKSITSIDLGNNQKGILVGNNNWLLQMFIKR